MLNVFARLHEQLVSATVDLPTDHNLQKGDVNSNCG